MKALFANQSHQLPPLNFLGTKTERGGRGEAATPPPTKAHRENVGVFLFITNDLGDTLKVIPTFVGWGVGVKYCEICGTVPSQ